VSFPTVRVAAIQATPAILDAEASVDKALDLLEQAAKDNVQLAVFPEVFIPLYESGAWAHDAASFDGWNELWERLSAGGQQVQCGWLKDRFGLSWQVVPASLERMMMDADAAKCERVMQAVLQMKKLEIETLQRAYDGAAVPAGAAQH
jgi:hypothetical protein